MRVYSHDGPIRRRKPYGRACPPTTTCIPFSARHFEYSIEYSTYIPCRQTAIGWSIVDSGLACLNVWQAGGCEELPRARPRYAYVTLDARVPLTEGDYCVTQAVELPRP
eukprot:1471171-Pyramimonas_sp.AAC.1